MASVDELCNASASGKLDKVKTLLHNGADVNGFNEFNRTALQVGTYTSFTLVSIKVNLGKMYLFFVLLFFYYYFLQAVVWQQPVKLPIVHMYCLQEIRLSIFCVKISSTLFSSFYKIK